MQADTVTTLNNHRQLHGTAMLAPQTLLTSGQGGDIGPGDVLVFTIEIIKINGASKEAQRGPPPYAVAA